MGYFVVHCYKLLSSFKKIKKELELSTFRIKMAVNTRFLQLIAEFIAILYLLMQGHVLCDGGFNITSEAEALLEFKVGLKDPSNRLSSWAPRKDCCQWKGVGCNTTTGDVISLNLHCANSLEKLQGEFRPSLPKLPYLSSLNLSGNDFMQSSVPAFLGTMQNLKHLDLSDANFKGSLPDNLGNLSLLESLDLSGNDFSVDNLKWLHGLSSLKILDLSGADLSSCANDWFHDISALSHLVTLHLSYCQLHKLPTSLPEVKFDSLITLDLSDNYFNNPIPDWLFENCHHLQHLNLSSSRLQGPIPDSIERLTTLATLDLSHNKLIGSIPDSIDKLISLVVLDLSYNKLTGSIPSTLGQAHGQNGAATNSCLKELRLSNNQLNGSLERSLRQLSELVLLDLARNKLEGNITDAHLANFSSLRVLDLSFNLVALNMSKNWVPPFQLETIGLANCQLGPQFPKWFQTQKNFSYIDISNAGISDSVPYWFWDLSPSTEYMNLSDNKLRRCGQDFSQNFKLQTLDLSNNDFSCPLPRLPPNTRTLDLSNNPFHGTISHVCEMLGVNNSLEVLDLSLNNLSGVIPNCWTCGGKMTILNLEENHFYGSIPDSFGSLTNLHILNIRSNNLSGIIPNTLKDCKVLTLLDLGLNRFWGPIPSWIGTEMQILKVLILRGNAFEENIPTSLCLLKSLQILDLAENQLTGAIPRCVFPAMATQESINDKSYMEFVTMKGSLSIYRSKMNNSSKINYRSKMIGTNIILKVIDLSSNFLTQDIPVEIAEFVELNALNLSRNQLVGSIPSNIGEMGYLFFLDLSWNQLVGSIPSDIGEMRNLELLDLSTNQLSCAIPTSMVNLSFLSYLNLSYNTLSGKIPTGTQLQSFDESSFEGNPRLCGPPLRETCPGNSSFEDTHCRDSEERNREHENDGNREDNGTGLGIYPLYISIAMGFFTGFWVFWGSLVLNASWRYAYFRFLDNMTDRIYVTVAVAHAKLQRKLQSQQPSL